MTAAYLMADEIDGGWIAPQERTVEQYRAVEEWHDQIGVWEDIAVYTDEPEQFFLYDLEVKATGSLMPRVQQLTGSCLPADAPVRMADGTEKPISEIVPGDLVVTHTGMVRRVNGVQAKRTSEQMRKIHVRAWADDLYCTDKHLVPTYKNDEITWKKAQDVLPGEWLLIGYATTPPVDQMIDLLDWIDDAIDIDRADKWEIVRGKGERIEQPNRFLSRPAAFQSAIRQKGLVGRSLVTVRRARLEHALPRFINVDEDFARWIGLYLAEGSCDKHRINFTLSADEHQLGEEIVQLTRKIFGIEASIGIKQANRSVLWVRVPGKALVSFIKAFCPGVATSKRVPGVFFRSKERVQASLVSGWFDGDGHARVKNTYANIVGVTASSGLARDMAHLAASAGVPSSTRRRKARGHSKEATELTMFPKHACDVVPSEKLAAVAAVSAKQKTTCQTRFGIAKRVVSNEEVGVPVDAVWDIEVDVDHTFIAYGYVVHNCVGAGAGRAYCHSQCGDVVQRGDTEAVMLPFPWATYGVGREKAGMRRAGEGSFGEAQAKAVAEFGMLPLNSQFATQGSVRNGWIRWTEAIEMEWSHPSAWKHRRADVEAEAGKYKMQTVSRVTTPEGLCQAIAQGYGVTLASMFGTNPRVEQGYLLGRWNKSWAHQMSCGAYVKNSPHGLVFAIDNQWGDMHGTCPVLSAKGVNGSFWMLAKDMQKVMQNGEVYVHSNTMGFPVRKFDFSNWWSAA